MADLYELIAPYFDASDSPSSSLSPPAANDAQTRGYLARLSTLSLSDLTSTEPASLLQAAQSHLRTLQALSKRSHKAVIASSSHLAGLARVLPSLSQQASGLRDDLPSLESTASEFAQKYDRNAENAVLDRRKRAMLLSRNVDRISDVLELPALLSTAIAAAQSGNAVSASTTATSYASALDLHSHIKRLRSLYAQSQLMRSISNQAEAEIENLTTILITSLQIPSLKLAAAIRTTGWLRRVAPDLAVDGLPPRDSITSTNPVTLADSASGEDGVLGTLFLVCRLHMLRNMLQALEPLRDLAEQESARRNPPTEDTRTKLQLVVTSHGSQSERYLKRYIEIFREQSFAIVSMYKGIFPSRLPSHEDIVHEIKVDKSDRLLPLPAPISSFVLRLMEMLMAELRAYLPNISDRSARESLLTQVLYCAGSLGRLGADFGMMVALLDDDGSQTLMPKNTEDDALEWAQVMEKHRVQASRLELLARGVENGRKANLSVQSPNNMPAE